MHMKDTVFSFTTVLGSLLLATLLTVTGCSPEPIQVVSVEGPDSLNVNETGQFTATVASEEDEAETPDLPVEYTWEWGDGTTSEGTLAEDQGGNSATGEHAYSDGGDYNIIFTATNDEGENQASGDKSVVVVAPPEIVTVNASSTNVQVGDEVEFQANVRGTEPLRYNWEFGDGETSSSANPSHTYQADGSQTVSLTVENRAGSVSRSLTINVEPEQGPCDLITELNTVHFGFDESSLDSEAESLLAENVEAVSGCPNLNIRIDAYTDHVGSDQYNLRLSERRARTVEDYYTGNGVVGSRLNPRGLGKAPTPCLKEDAGQGCRQNRRAESIPMQ